MLFRVFRGGQHSRVLEIMSELILAQCNEDPSLFGIRINQYCLSH